MKWLVWAVAIAAYVFSIINRSSFSALGATAQTHFGVEATALSLFIMLQLVVYASCQVPVGVYAQPVDNADILEDAHAGKAEAIRVEAVIASLDGRKLFRDSVEGAADEAENLGISLANKLLDMGGREILRSLGIEL